MAGVELLLPVVSGLAAAVVVVFEGRTLARGWDDMMNALVKTLRGWDDGRP